MNDTIDYDKADDDGDDDYTVVIKKGCDEDCKKKKAEARKKVFASLLFSVSDFTIRYYNMCSVVSMLHFIFMREHALFVILCSFGMLCWLCFCTREKKSMLQNIYTRIDDKHASRENVRKKGLKRRHRKKDIAEKNEK